MFHSLFRYFGVLVLWDLPSRLHHSYEILVTWGGHGEITIVVVPLFPGYDTIVVALGSIKIIEELGQDLIFRLFPF